MSRLIAVVLLCIAVALSRCSFANADADADVIVDDLNPMIFAKRQRNRRAAKAAGKAENDDDDVEGVNEFADAARDVRFDNFGAHESSGGDEKGERSSSKGKSGQEDESEVPPRKSSGKRKEYEERRREYEEGNKQQYDSPKDKPTGATKRAAAFKPRHPKDSKNVVHSATNLRDEVNYYSDMLSGAASEPSGSLRGMFPEAAAHGTPLLTMVADVMAGLPVGFLHGDDLADAQQFVNRGSKASKKLEAALTKAKASESKDAMNAATAENLLQIALDEMSRVTAAVQLHENLRNMLAHSSLAVSVASASLAKQQLDMVSALMTDIRKSDDGGVGDSEGRRKRKEIKELHKFAEKQVDLFSKGRRSAQSYVATSAAIPVEMAELFLLTNLMARSAREADLPIADHGAYRPSPTLTIFGLSLNELLVITILCVVPYQSVKVTIAVNRAIRRLMGKRPADSKFGMPGVGRRLGDSAAQATRRQTVLRRAIIELALSVCSCALICWLLPNFSLPAFAHVTPATLRFVLTHLVTKPQLIRTAVMVSGLHVAQVITSL